MKSLKVLLFLQFFLVSVIDIVVSNSASLLHFVCARLLGTVRNIYSLLLLLLFFKLEVYYA